MNELHEFGWLRWSSFYPHTLVQTDEGWLLPEERFKTIPKLFRKVELSNGNIRVLCQCRSEAGKVEELTVRQLQTNCGTFFHKRKFKTFGLSIPPRISSGPQIGLAETGSPFRKDSSSLSLIDHLMLERLRNFSHKFTDLGSKRRGESGSYSEPGGGKCPLSLYPTPILRTSGDFCGFWTKEVTVRKSGDQSLLSGTFIECFLNISASSLALSIPQFFLTGRMFDMIWANGLPKFLEELFVSPIKTSYDACATTEYFFVENNNSKRTNH